MDLKKPFNEGYQFLRRIFTFSKKCNQRQEISNPFNKYEYYIYKFQSIVVWERPVQTLSCLLVIQLLFWMVVNLCWKFYGIIFTLLLIFCTHDVWTEKIWPEIRVAKPEMTPYQDNWISSNPRILNINELNEYFNKFMIHLKMTLVKLRNLRNSYPMLFCSTLSFVFGMLTIVGCTISGIWLLYVLVMTVFLSPGIYIHVLPPSYKSAAKEYLNIVCHLLSSDAAVVDNDEDEYIPKMSKENLKTLDEAYASVFHVDDSESSNTAAFQDSLVSGLTAMPSYDDTSIDGFAKHGILDEDSIKQLDISDTSSVSSDVSESMKFQGSHFDHGDDEFDTSSDDNESAFIPDVASSSVRNSNKDKHPSQSSDVLFSSLVSKLTLPGINQLGRNILTNIMPSSKSTSSQNKPTQQQQPNQCSTDEEFEIVNESDIN
ncbi:reticulophagy regulator 1-like [Planococcus citri]|uniref:reticulophagy regulator 1-like n=1 Tax=Planococcus citri TaxID=170843 RepID=UPI0031F917A0